MAISSGLEQIHEGIAPTPESCIAELGEILENIATDPSFPQHTSFPAHLFDAILEAGVTVSSHNTERLIQAIGKIREPHKSLNEDSIRLLAYTLLTSDDKAEQERGLHLLLENFRNHAEPQEKPSKEELLPPSDQSLPIRYKLIPILYTLFLDKDRNKKCRRMAGKLLIESMVECRDTGIPTFQPQELSSYCLRTVSDAHHETDIVLRFFAGFMISTLHLSGTNEDVLWSSCGQHCRDEFVKCLQEFPGDWIRSFHLFVSDEEHLQPRNTRANSRKNGRSGSTNAHSCYLAQSITIGAHSFTHYAILVSTTPDSLIFILPAREADGRHFQYIEIPDQYILQCTQCTTKDLGEQKYALHLILNTAGSLMINGEEKPFNGSTVCINSDNDLRALYNALKESERKPKKGRVIRRISSTIVALDNGEEVARKSIQHFESSSEQQGCLSVNAGDAMDDNQESGIPGQPANEENTQSESARVTPAVDESQPTASREMFTSSAALGGTCLPVSPGKSAISEPRDADAQPPEKAHPIDCDTNLAETYLDKGDALLSKDLTSNAESEANADNSTGPQISNAESITLQPRHSSRSSTREQETQNKSPVSRNKRGRASNNRKDRSKLPNTQESLLFPLRRSTRKVYTSNSKAAVDWEEDLRPTEEDETEREVPKDLDVTSISSPSPGGKSIFNRKSNTAQKKRKARATPSSTKGKNQAKINRKSGNRGNKRTPKLPLQPKELNGRNDKAEEINSPRIDDTTDNVSGSSKSENRANGRPDILREKKGSSELAHHSAGTNDKTFSVSDQDLLSDKENRDPSVRSPHEQGEPGNVVISGIDPDMKTASDLREQGLGEREQASPDREGIKSRDRYSLPQDHNIPPICGDDEQTPLAGCISTQGALVPDKRPNYETTLNRREDSQNPKAVSKTDELFPASVEKYQTLNTSTHAATNEETMDASQQSMSEQYHPASDNKKRSAPQDRTSESQSKKARMSVFPVPYQQAMPQSGDLVTKNSGDDDISKEKPQTDNLSTRNSPGEECFTIPSPKSRDFRARRIPSPFNVSSQTKSSPLSTSSLKKSIVDENGSPRLVSRHYDSLDITRREIQFPRLEYLDEDTSSHSEYYGDHDDADFTDYSMSDKSSISTLRGPQAVASTTNESKTHPVSVLPGDTDEVEEGDHLNIGSRIPVSERPKGCTKEPNQLVKMMITPYSILGSPRKEASPEVQDPVLQGAASNDFAQPQPEVTERGKSIGRGHDQPDWQRSMETMQKATQDMLLSTNQRLMKQLEGEKDTISQVLDSYRQGCHRFLDQLFHAHEQRIELYRQQMTSVKQQHEDICRDLIHRFEENDKRIQERLSIA